MSGPAAGWLPDGRLHLQHGPIDLVIEAFGPAGEVTAAYRQGWAAFRPVLDGLVAVLPTLRTPVGELIEQRMVGQGPTLRETGSPGDVGRASHRRVGPWPTTADAPDPHRTRRRDAPAPPYRGWMGRGRDRPLAGGDAGSAGIAEIPPGSPAARMIAAAAAHAPVFVTPMAAVAGAVADHVLAAMTQGRRLDRAYVNNGGDAALWLSPGAEITAAGGPDLSARIRIGHNSPVRGIATSGWRGRSHSLGIADAVTVLARCAAEADAAATLVANAVDLPGHPAVTRRPARELAPDSDLGDRPVTVAVGPLAPGDVARALHAGRAAADRMRHDGLIAAAALWLGGECVIVGEGFPARTTPPSPLRSGTEREDAARQPGPSTP